MPDARAASPIRVALLALAATLAALVGPAPADEGRVLVISDIHFDPFFDGSLFGRLAAAPAEGWGAILAESKPAGPSPRGADSNDALLRSALDDARARCPRPDVVLYPGDFLAHGWQRKYDAWAPRSHLDDPGAFRDFTTKAIRYLADQFRRRFPGVSILPTLGNDDSYCGDYMVTPNGPFLAMFAREWEHLLGPGVDLDAFRETFPRAGYYSARLPGPARLRLAVLNSVFCSVQYDDACGDAPRTPALDQLDWLARTLSRAEADGEGVWLLMHIPPGINSFNTARALERGGTPETFWQPELTARFLQLVARHRETLRFAFAGHTHMDDFRAYPAGDGPALALKIAPAVSPIFGNNPGYQVFRFDRASGRLLDFETFALPLSGPDPGADWAREYAFRDAYGLPLDAPGFARLAEALAVDPAAAQRYSTYYGVGAPPEFPEAELAIYRCAIANPTPGRFLGCLGPTARPAIPHPDRAAPAPLPAGK